jgi:hypothetical protein
VEERFILRQRVRLVADLVGAEASEGVRAGSEGTIVGFYRRTVLEYAVSFEGEVHRVPAELLAPAETAP